MIELFEFGKDYGDFTAVQSLTLKIDAGEMFGFIGPNGAGKSTTIRYLATLLKASRGDATVNGFSVNRDPMSVRQSIGYMPDDFGVYDGMKVWEFLDFFAVAYKIGRTQRKQVILDVLELLDVSGVPQDVIGVDSLKLPLANPMVFHHVHGRVEHGRHVEHLSVVHFFLNGPVAVIVIQVLEVNVEVF